jgi:hypothetical protein
MACHPPDAQAKLREVLASGRPNVYTIEKKRKKKLVYQCQWRKGRRVGGVVQFVIELPRDMPHHVRAVVGSIHELQAPHEEFESGRPHFLYARNELGLGKRGSIPAIWIPRHRALFCECRNPWQIPTEIGTRLPFALSDREYVGTLSEELSRSRMGPPLTRNGLLT